MINKFQFRTLFPLIIFFALLSFSAEAVPASVVSKPFRLQLKIKDFANGTIRLFGIYGDQNYGIDSTFVDADGKAAFAEDTALLGGMYFVIFSDQSLVQILVDQDQQFSLEFNKNDAVNSMIVTGSVDNELLYRNLKFEAATNKKTGAIQEKMNAAVKGSAEFLQLESEMKQLKDERKAHVKSFSDKYPNSFFTKFKMAGQNPDLKKPLLPNGTIDEQGWIYEYRNEFWNGYDFGDERLLRTPVYFNKLKRYIEEITPQIPDSIIKYADWVSMKSKANRELFKFTVNWIAIKYKEAKILGRESVYVFMVEKYWTADQAFWAKDYEITRLRMQAAEMKVSLLGKTGHDIKGKSEIDKPISLYDITSPVTVIYIFSYDCSNCKKETPKLVKVYNEWKNKGLDVFSICIDGDRDKWKDYLQQNGMNFHNIFDPANESNFRSYYYFEATPGMFVLDKNRKILANNIGAESLHVILEKEIPK